MIEIPRLGLAVASGGLEPSMAGLALLSGLVTLRRQVQHFRAKACPTGTEVVGQVTGLPGKHLDAWLMPPEVAQAVLARGARNADLALVEGTLDRPCLSLEPGAHGRPGGLGPLVDALDLPVIAVIEAPRGDGFHLPNLPASVDAILLDNLADPDDFPRLKHLVGHLARRPVVGAVESLPEVRRALAEAGPRLADADDLIGPLAATFLRFADLDAIDDLARSRPPVVPPCLTGGLAPRAGVRVAYALDDAFGGYFPDTLETLEWLGADLVDFSPLRDEALPDDVELVMIGCGFPDRFAETLALNQCMISALKSHVCQGRRIYSEGGGTAYLGRSMDLGDRVVAGAGILPFDAVLRADPTAPVPVERLIVRDGWLGLRGTTIRGYRTGRWNLIPAEVGLDCGACSGTLSAEGDFTYHHHAVGSLLHLHLGVVPEVVSAFLRPHRPSLKLPTLRTDR